MSARVRVTERRGVVIRLLAVGAAALLTVGCSSKEMAGPLAESSPFDASKDPLISRNSKIMLVEGSVAKKTVRNSKNHSGMKTAAGSEAEEQRAYSSKNHLQAEFDFDVEQWVHGNGPTRITIIKGVSPDDFSSEAASGEYVTYSGAWHKENYEAVQVGARYRVYVLRMPWYQAQYFTLASEDFGDAS